MADVAASANDPIFLNHHAMVDCIFETWLQKYPNARYPMDDDKIPSGHKYHDYIVPFFPLYKHSDMFTTADNFGYQCIIKSSNDDEPESHSDYKGIIVGIIVGLVVPALCVLCCVLIWCCIRHYRKPRNVKSESSMPMKPHKYDSTTDTSALIQVRKK